MRTTTGDFGRTGKPVRLYDGFLQKRRVVEARLREAGLDEGELREWLQPGPTEFTPGRLEDSLREAGVPEAPLEISGERTTELEELLQESASTSDFGNYLNDKATKRLLWAFTEAPSAWRQYTRTYSVPDFKPISFVALGEMEDLLPVPEGGSYVDSELPEEVGPTVSVGTFGRVFTITRKAIINDDLNQLRDRPAAMGRATVRSMSKSIIGLLESNPNTVDGQPAFSVAHNNLITGEFSEENVAKLITAMRTQRDRSGNRMALRPRALVIPAEKELRAMVIQQSTTVPLAGYAPASTRDTALDHGQGGANVIASVVRSIIVEDYLNDPEDYYAFADPNQAPGLAMGFLNGKETPDVFLRDPGMRNVLGTSDPYDMWFDEVGYKVRHDWGNTILDYRGIAKGTN